MSRNRVKSAPQQIPYHGCYKRNERRNGFYPDCPPNRGQQLSHLDPLGALARAIARATATETDTGTATATATDTGTGTGTGTGIGTGTAITITKNTQPIRATPNLVWISAA